MDGMLWPSGLFDLWANLSTQAKKQHLKRRGSKAGSARAAAAKGNARKQEFEPLVEEDGLFFCFLPPTASPKPSPALVDTFRKRAADLGQRLRRTFVEVWSRIPGSDRGCMVNYWRSDPYPALPDDPPPPVHRPAISIVDGGPASVSCNRFGHELSFSAALIEACAQRLPAEIGQVLAQVHRYATRAHWELIAARLEGPMDRWESRRGTKATETEREAKWAALESAFLRAHEAETARLLRRWGLEESRPR